MSPLTTIVVGPLTRAGQAVTARATERGDRTYVVARHAGDSAALSGGDATVLRIDQRLDLLGVGDGPVRIIVCALGPIHPDEVSSDDDHAAFARDLDVVERLLLATAGRPTGVVLISSIIALAPGADRRYYGGFKCLVEQRLGEVAARAGAALAVVYPGRLVDRPSHSRLALHTSFQRLAVTAESVAGTSSSRISGLDARLWLVVNAARLVTTTILPPRAHTPSTSLELRMSPSERNSRP
ncbi:hypothetical protein [Aeromicrobium fastidiosum]|uniref:SDR family NAD(P)-dependent oxidoreductase n=1 Tax=Aeromicrobium fastidiosum TaxID=52699 RepID=A0A641AN64_9ACTN|nr:hypothetical protein [Aeromicrobium fastidiosum]KAA1378714.1 hypothetical protein ESP62_010285 [Aeromicrobium fastidiosum]MBP2392298.1 hypothetical protein [Aeromicrobium fastidiosum]